MNIEISQMSGMPEMNRFLSEFKDYVEGQEFMFGTPPDEITLYPSTYGKLCDLVTKTNARARYSEVTLLYKGIRIRSVNNAA